MIWISQQLNIPLNRWIYLSPPIVVSVRCGEDDVGDDDGDGDGDDEDDDDGECDDDAGKIR